MSARENQCWVIMTSGCMKPVSAGTILAVARHKATAERYAVMLSRKGIQTRLIETPMIAPHDSDLFYHKASEAVSALKDAMVKDGFSDCEISHILKSLGE